MHGPRCFLQELPGHVHFCTGGYGEDSSRLCNFEGFKLVTNLKETKEAKCKSFRMVQCSEFCCKFYSFQIPPKVTWHNKNINKRAIFYSGCHFTNTSTKHLFNLIL